MSVNFPVANALINCGSASILNNLAPISISSWIFVNSMSAFGGIASKGATTGGWFFIIRGTRQSLEYYQSFLNASDFGQWRTALSSISIGVWTHVGVTYLSANSSNVPTLYINGVSGTVTVVASPGGAKDSDSTMNLYLGIDTIDAGSFRGVISEVAVWNSILTPEEMRSIYSSRIKGIALQIKPSLLVGYWPLDDFPNNSTLTGASSVRDRSFYGNNGTPANSPVSTAEQILSYP